MKEKIIPLAHFWIHGSKVIFQATAIGYYEERTHD